MKFVEYVPDHILRDFAKIGQKRTVLAGAQVRVMIPSLGATYSYEEQTDIEITISNFLPGYTEVYTDRDGVKPIHNHQFVWIVNDRNGDPHEYRSTDINNMKEVRDASSSNDLYIDFKGWRFRPPFHCMRCGVEVCPRQWAFSRSCGACDTGNSHTARLHAVDRRLFAGHHELINSKDSHFLTEDRFIPAEAAKDYPVLDPPRPTPPPHTEYLDDRQYSRYQGEFLPKGPERQGEF